MKTRRRSGFTLVEVLVSMALILFIMSILAGAFGAASQAVSDLKAAGDLAEKLRSATNVLKHDLGQDHFTDSSQGSAHLSDPAFWTRLNAGNTPSGFFRIYETQRDIQETPGTPVLDLDNIPSFVQTTAALHFTIAQHGTRRSDFLSTVVAAGSPLLQPSPVGPYPNLDNFYEDTAGVFSSQYAEVEFFLGPTVDSTDASTGTGAKQLFALYRRQQLAVTPGWAANTAAVDAGDTELSMANNLVNTMQALSMPANRFNCTGVAGTPTGGTYPPMAAPNVAADLLLTDVLSFDVRVLAGSLDPMTNMITPDNEFRDLADLQSYNTGANPAYPNNGSGPFVFDTWSNQGVYSTWNTPGTPASIPMLQASPGGHRIIILAVQITLRVWDFKTKKTRQVTIVQQM